MPGPGRHYMSWRTKPALSLKLDSGPVRSVFGPKVNRDVGYPSKVPAFDTLRRFDGPGAVRRCPAIREFLPRPYDFWPSCLTMASGANRARNVVASAAGRPMSRSAQITVSIRPRLGRQTEKYEYCAAEPPWWLGQSANGKEKFRRQAFTLRS